MKAKELPSLDYLRECFELSDMSPSGLIWKKRPRGHFDSERVFKMFNTQYAGRVAGYIWKSPTQAEHTYWCIGLDKKTFKVHRIIFKLHSRTPLPVDIEVDHIDGNKLNNITSNLRVATHNQNQYNSSKYKTNKIGLKGVHEKNGMFKAQICVNRKVIYLGRFVTPEQAHAAYCEASKKLQGHFSRTA